MLCCIFSQVAAAKGICNPNDLHLFPLSHCHYCFLANDWHCLKKQHLVVEGRLVAGMWGYKPVCYGSHQVFVARQTICLSVGATNPHCSVLHLFHGFQFRVYPTTFPLGLRPLLKDGSAGAISVAWSVDSPFPSCAPFWGFPERECCKLQVAQGHRSHVCCSANLHLSSAFFSFWWAYCIGNCGSC